MTGPQQPHVRTGVARYVLTGAMGAGKSAIVAELVRLGIRCAPEFARAVIAEQRAIVGDGLFDRNPQRFLDLMLERAIAEHEAAGARDGPVVFDRGVPDLIVYAEIFGLDTSEATRAAHGLRYDDPVFFAPSWPEIYATDAERRMTFEQADAFGRRVRSVYAELDYHVVDVPLSSEHERAGFIASTIGILK